MYKLTYFFQLNFATMPTTVLHTRTHIHLLFIYFTFSLQNSLSSPLIIFSLSLLWRDSGVTFIKSSASYYFLLTILSLLKNSFQLNLLFCAIYSRPLQIKIWKFIVCESNLYNQTTEFYPMFLYLHTTVHPMAHHPDTVQLSRRLFGTSYYKY